MTVYTFDESIVSDLHKDAFGCRPREYFWAEWNNSADAEKQVIWDDLLESLERANEWARAEQAAAVKQFERRIELLMNMGASTRETAIRWIIESMNLSENDKLYGGSYICFELGLPYNMKETFDELVC
jgi:predicted Fe-S protein YdhL (DUF1289 family)